MSRLDDARERVDGQGRIRGIRASDSFSSMLAGFAVLAGAFDPMALIFSLSSSLSVFRLPDSSVVLPAGTELRFRVGADLKVEEVFGEQYPALGGGSRAELEGVVKELPFRTATKTDGTLSDLTSLLYLGSQEAIERAFEAAVKNYSSKLSFSLSGGLTGFGGSTVTTLPTTVVVNSGGQVIRDPLRFDSTLERGWTLSPKITMNTWKYVSNEFAYTRSQTNFRLVGKDELTGMGIDSRSKAAVRTFTYNTVVHLTPNGRRVRPYVAAGPAVQLIHLLDARPETNGLLKFAARDVALFVTAYNFGSKPALDGGGVFQFGLNYGGGVKVHVTPRLFMRVDFRETVTRKPDFWKSLPQRLKESTDTEVLRLEYGPVVRGGALRHQVVTMGIGVAF